jgi:hypothetical protein
MLKSEVYLALKLGCGGNRYTESRYWVTIPADFDSLDQTRQAQILCAEVKRLGGFISYESNITKTSCDGTNVQPHDCAFAFGPEALFYEPVVPPKKSIQQFDRVRFVKAASGGDSDPPR